MLNVDITNSKYNTGGTIPANQTWKECNHMLATLILRYTIIDIINKHILKNNTITIALGVFNHFV